jgi:uncharacterized protein (DUF1810 family)
MNDPFRLQRFIEAQDSVYEDVLKELKMGQKISHWMWYIFPQIRGLGHSTMAQEFAINSLEEARAYLDHPLLEERLRTCTQVVINTEGRTSRQFFGYTDDLKFRSSMTLFNYVAENNQIFKVALLKYYEGKPDKLTLDILKDL